MTTYKYRIRNTKISNEAGDRVVILQSFLEDVNANQFLLNGSLDLFEVRIPSSILPGSGYAAFIEGVVTQRISDKYKISILGSAVDGSNELTLANRTGLRVGMGVSGPGVSAGTILDSLLSDTKAVLSRTVSRVFTGTLTNESVVTTGTTAAASPNITSIPSTAALSIGMSLTGTGVPAGAIISVITGATSLTMSQDATTSVVAGSLTFSPSPLTRTITSISPALMASTFRNMGINGTGIQQDTTVAGVLSTSSIKISQNATASGTQTLTFSGQTSFVFDPANWTLDLSEVSTLVSLIDFSLV